MGPSITNELYSVFEALKPALRSMDVRTFAVSAPEGDWQNLVTSVYLTENSVDEVRKQQEKMLLREPQLLERWCQERTFAGTCFSRVWNLLDYTSNVLVKALWFNHTWRHCSNIEKTIESTDGDKQRLQQK